MPLFDFNKTLSQSTDALKSLSALNPLTIHKKGTRAKAIFALSLVSILWGTTWLASKQGVKYIPDGLQMAGIRQLIGGICYVSFFLYKRMPLPKGKEWIPIIVLSFLNFNDQQRVLAQLPCNTKYQQDLALSSVPSFHYGWWSSALYAKRKIPVLAIVGLLLGFGGVCVIFYEHFNEFFDSQFRWGIYFLLLLHGHGPSPLFIPNDRRSGSIRISGWVCKWSLVELCCIVFPQQVAEQLHSLLFPGNPGQPSPILSSSAR
jgi:drug/metabolite transporter (DMT)-like permease